MPQKKILTSSYNVVTTRMLGSTHITHLRTILFTCAIGMSSSKVPKEKALADSYAAISFGLCDSPNDVRLTKEGFDQLTTACIGRSFKGALGDDWKDIPELAELALGIRERCEQEFNVALAMQDAVSDKKNR
jgi:hypothetical protein